MGGFLFLAATGIVTASYLLQEGKIVRGVTIGNQNVGSLRTIDALSEVEEAWAHFSTNAFRFSLEEKTYQVPLAGSSESIDEVILDVGTFDAESSVNAAYDFGHRGPWWQQAHERLSGFLGRPHEFGRFVFADKTAEDILRKQLKEVESEPVDASIAVTKIGVTISESKNGQTVNYQAAIKRAQRQLVSMDSSPIALRAITIQPEVPYTTTLLIAANAQVPTLLAQAPLTLTLGEETWKIEEAKLQTLLGFETLQNVVRVSLDGAKTLAYLETIRPDIEIAPRDAKFSITNGRVKEFQTSVLGRTLDPEVTLARMRAALVSKTPTVQVAVAEVKPLTDTIPTNDLGIKELVAEAKTNFRGSPTNRRFNLGFGAEKLNGLLIKPGETFSLVKALGSIDQKSGWKPELVIKGTKITPEFGGGLCQVATTLFRTALNAGLPINERTNHSLRISYYEPPIGLDATIYEPKPDLKFTNDYGTALLIQTRIEGTELIFSFYGTKDLRTVDLPEPKVFNKTGIPPTKNIEVDDLKPGEKECQAPGHPGADALATYTVTKADGTKVVQEFKSHYRPLPVICRVGKAKKV